MFKIIFMKEMKDVLRDRRSITLLILFPFLMMAGLTFFYDKLLSTEKENSFELGVEASADDELVSQLQAAMPDMKIVRKDDVRQAVEESEVQAALKIDPDWQEKMEQEQPVQVGIVYDPGSQESSIATSIIKSAFSAWQQEAIQLRLDGKNVDSRILNVFEVETVGTKNEDNAAATLMLTILIPLLIPIAIANGSYPSATELFAGEKEKKTIEALLITPVKPMKILLAKWMTIALLGIFTGLLCIGVLSVMINFTTELKKGFESIEQPVSFVVMSIVLVTLFSIFISALEIILSMMANSVKEAGYYIAPVISLISLPMLFMFFLSEKVNVALYTVPVMNLFLFVRDSFNGGLTQPAFYTAAASYIVLTAILFPIASKLFSNRKLMLGK